jgi:hypothetical protein
MKTNTLRAALALTLSAGLAAFGASPAFAAGAAAAPAASAASAANAVRPEFATPFNAAQQAMKAGQGQEALAKLKEAEAIGNLSPYETYLVTRVRGPAAYAAGDMPTAERDFEASLNSPMLPAEDRPSLTKALATIYYSDKKYDQAADYMQKFFAAGGEDAQLRELLPQTLYMSKKYPEASKAFQAQVDAEVAAGRKPEEKTLRLLASAQSQAGEEEAYAKTIERLAVTYPKPDYWSDVLARVSNAKMDDRLHLDLYRLRTAALGQTPDRDRLNYAFQAAHFGFPGEAKVVLDQGFSKNAFSGGDASEAKKLNDQVSKAAAQDKAQLSANEASAKSAKDGEALVSLGLSLSFDGQTDKGLALVEQGIAKGGLKRPDEAKLHLGIVQWRAGKADEALKTFQSVSAAGPVGQFAHAWALVVQSGAKPA